MVEIVGAHRMWMQFEAGQVGHPRQRRRIARDDFFRRSSGGKPQGDHFDPLGRTAARASDRRIPRRRRSGSARARWAARPPPQGAVGDRHVVADEIALRAPNAGNNTLSGFESETLRPPSTMASVTAFAAIEGKVHIDTPDVPG